MLRTIAGGVVHAKQVRSSSCVNTHPVWKCKKLYSTPKGLPKEGQDLLKHPEIRTLNRTPAFLQHLAENETTTPLQKKISPPLFVHMEQSRQAFPEATWNRMNLITPLLLSFQARGIGSFVRNPGAGNFNTAVHTLIQARKVLLCTGFNIAENMPETDGPLGTALLAYACFRADKEVVLVADQHNAHLLRMQLSLLDKACARSVFIEEVQANGKAPFNSWKDILDKYHPDAVVHTEVPGRNKDGKYLNMRGIEISDFNAALDGIADVANAQGLNTIGVGDGGNEAGMGQIRGIPKALNMEEMQAIIPAAHQVIAWNSNLGAIALGEFVMSAAGKGPSCNEEKFNRMLHVMFKEGAVDGITRGRKIDEKIENPASAGQYNFTCVDGARSAIHIGNLLQVQDIAHNVPLTFPASLSSKGTS